MAQPVYTSLDPLEVKDGYLHIGRGNWGAGLGLEQMIRPKWTCTVAIDGQMVRGVTPGMPSVKEAVVYPGELSWEYRCGVNLKPWADGKPHVALVRVYAASFFQGWGDHPENAWEWGHYSSSDGTAALLTKSFLLGAPPPPPPDPSALYPAATAKQRIVAEVEHYRAGRTDIAIYATRLYMIELLALHTNDEAWKRNRDAIMALVREA